MKNKKLLTIGIPTYNRSYFLKICLDSICEQITGLEQYIEINISDNASSDSTENLVKDYIQKGISINYYKNNENTGLDRNFAKLYDLAETKYIWMISDDDFLFPNTLMRVIQIMLKEEFGVMYINNYWYTDEINISFYNEKEKTQITRYDNHISFIERVNYWITFTSAIIVNKSVVKDKIDIYEFDKTMLLLLGWILPATNQRKPNILLENTLIGCKAENTGGYKLFEVFGLNFNKIMDRLIAKGLINKKVKNIINNHLLTSFFPNYINNNNKSFNSENPLKILILLYWRNLKFWKSIFPTLLKKTILK